MRGPAGRILACLLALTGQGIPLSDARAQTSILQAPAEIGKHPVRSRQTAGTGFDFYVLSLSWSPTWCRENDEAGKTLQCRADKDYRFIVHGLWPQNERGFPAFCRTRDSDRVPESLGRTLFDIIPSMGLIGHEWRKHGTCSGLGQRDYFATVRRAREAIRIPAMIDSADDRRRMSPAMIETALAEANPGLSPAAVAVTCDNGLLDEIRICLTKDLRFRACTEIDRGGCKAASLTIPSPR